MALGGPSPRIWSVEASGNTTSNTVGQCSEVLVISGHNAPVDRVRFHPSEPNCLCTSAADSTVRVFDIRAGVERSVGTVNVQQKSAIYVDWCPQGSGGGSASYLAVTERESVHVFDTRKLSSSGSSNAGRGGRNTTGGTSSKSTPLSTFQIPNVDMDACIFSPLGNHLVVATAFKGEMPSDLRIFPWKEGSEAFQKSLQEETQFNVPAHAGPIIAMAFSPDGKQLVSSVHNNGPCVPCLFSWLSDPQTHVCHTALGTLRPREVRIRLLVFGMLQLFLVQQQSTSARNQSVALRFLMTANGSQIATKKMESRYRMPRTGNPCRKSRCNFARIQQVCWACTAVLTKSHFIPRASY